MAEQTEKPEEKERGRFESGIVRAGVVAGAIAAIVGAVTAVVQLWPDEPARRTASFENIKVQPGVRLTEFNFRAIEDKRAAAAGGATVELRLVSQEVGGEEAADPAPEPEA
ncbi:MAG TPA: hypothetical protein VGW10_14620, partial [Solirubrobacteraceae bacterium]|nr:hypothetical protein [Solirubrobacteraceae bacterium]